MALSEQEEFELLSLEREKAGGSRLSRQAIAEKIADDPISRGAREVIETTTPELISAHPLVRGAIGAARPILGAAQLGAELLGDKTGTDVLAELERMQQRGGQALGSDVAGTVARGAGTAADVAGNILSPAFLKIAKALPQATTYGGKLAQGAALGGAAGATTPVTDEGSFAEQKAIQAGMGTALGGAIPGVSPLVTGLAKGGYHALIEPWANSAAIKGRAFLEAAGDKADEILALLKSNRQIVPGSLPTAGEAAAPAGRAEFAALQKSAERVNPSEYLARADEQNAARIVQLDRLGTPKSLEEAKSKRALQAAVDYGAARKEIIKSDAGLKMLLSRPSMDKALSRAAELAQEQGVPFLVAKEMPAQQVASKILGADGKPATISTIPAISSAYPVSSLHNVKLALDDMVKNPERFGIGASEVGAIKTTQKMFMKWFETKAPAYGTARANYAELSKPINQAEIGQYLEQKLVPALSDEAKQKSGVYAQALRDAPSTIKRATGEPRFDTLVKALTPEQLQAVNSVRDDLARGARFETMAQKGAGTANALDIASASMEKEAGGKIPNLLHRGAMIANAIISRVEGKINKKLAAEIAVEMLNPPKVAETLEAAMRRKTQNEILARVIERGRLSAVGGAIQETSKGSGTAIPSKEKPREEKTAGNPSLWQALSSFPDRLREALAAKDMEEIGRIQDEYNQTVERGRPAGSPPPLAESLATFPARLREAR